MNIDQLRHFSEIARCGSLTKATEALYLSQPSLSASIKKLEEALGEPVFNRSSTGVTLTPFGQDLLPYVRDILSLVDQMPNRAFGSNAKLRPRLSVAGGEFRFSSWAVTQVYEHHKEEGIHIDYYDVSREEAISMVAAGTAQVGCFAMYSFQKKPLLRRLESQELDFIPLVQAPVTVTVGRKNPLFQRTEEWVTLDMLRDFPLLYKFSEHTNSLQRRLGLSQGKNVLNCRTRAGRAELLSNTDCITVGAVPRAAYQKAAFYPGRRIFRIRDVEDYSEIGYIKQKKHPLSPLAEEFAQQLIALFAEPGEAPSSALASQENA